MNSRSEVNEGGQQGGNDEPSAAQTLAVSSIPVLFIKADELPQSDGRLRECLGQTGAALSCCTMHVQVTSLHRSYQGHAFRKHRNRRILT